MFTKFNQSIEARREALKDGEKGFTLIELLVVVIIIGILAAIAIPVFLNQRNAAWESAVKSDVKNAQIAAETFATQHNGAYTGLAYDATSMKTSDGVTLAFSGVSATGYTLKGTNANLPADKDTFTVTESGTIAGPSAN